MKDSDGAFDLARPLDRSPSSGTARCLDHDCCGMTGELSYPHWGDVLRHLGVRNDSAWAAGLSLVPTVA